MMDPVLRLSYKDTSFDVGKISAQELIQVTTWTGLKTRTELRRALLREDPTAIVAVFAIARRRAGESVSYSDVDVDLDEMQVALIDEDGREVEPVFETDESGAVKFQVDEDGDRVPLPVLVGGQPQYRYVETGETVPPTASVEGTPSPDTSTVPGASSASASVTPDTLSG